MSWSFSKSVFFGRKVGKGADRLIYKCTKMSHLGLRDAICIQWPTSLQRIWMVARTAGKIVVLRTDRLQDTPHSFSEKASQQKD